MVLFDAVFRLMFATRVTDMAIGEPLAPKTSVVGPYHFCRTLLSHFGLLSSTSRDIFRLLNVDNTARFYRNLEGIDMAAWYSAIFVCKKTSSKKFF
jgi:hypothetical protein